MSYSRPTYFSAAKIVPSVSKFREFIAAKLNTYIEKSYESDFLIANRLVAKRYLDSYINDPQIPDIHVMSMVFNHIEKKLKIDSKDNFAEVRDFLRESLCEYLGLSSVARAPQISAKIKAATTMEQMNITLVRPKL